MPESIVACVPSIGDYYPHWRALLALGLMLAAASAVGVTIVTVRTWFLLCTFARTRARSRGLCWGCGYDLRASPRRCPECGREIGF